MNIFQQRLIAGWTDLPKDPYFASVKLLLNGVTLDDTGPSHITGTAHGAASLASPGKFGSTTLRNSTGGSGSYVSYPITFTGGLNQDRTIEFFYQTLGGITNPTLWTASGAVYNPGCQAQTTPSPYFPIWNYRQSAQIAVATGTLQSAWSFVVLQQRRSTFEVSAYVDGIRVSNYADSATWEAINSVTALNIIGPITGAGLNGGMQCFRWTEGVARYSGATCPVPTTFFPELG